MTAAAPFEIRLATADDIGAINEMVTLLAEYEQLADSNACTEQALRNELCDPNGVLKAAVAIQEERHVGMATFFQTFSTFAGHRGVYLEDIYVREEARHQGVGSRLLRFVARTALDWNCSRVEWTTLIWNSGAMEFYESLGARPNDAWTTYRLDGDWLRRQADISRREATDF